jgi:hypothetical protein
MDQQDIEIVTLKPGWSIKDLFIGRDENESRNRILNQLNLDYLANGWELTDEIMWGKEFQFAVVKLERSSQE